MKDHRCNVCKQYQSKDQAKFLYKDHDYERYNILCKFCLKKLDNQKNNSDSIKNDIPFNERGEN
jgi:hypothetical protein